MFALSGCRSNPPGSRGGNSLNWKKITFPRYARLAVLLTVALLGASWLVFSMTEGWTAILLWVAIALPSCFVADFLMRERRLIRRSPKSLPRMKVRAGFSSQRPRAKNSGKNAEPDFPWHREQPTPGPTRRSAHRR